VVTSVLLTTENGKEYPFHARELKDNKFVPVIVSSCGAATVSVDGLTDVMIGLSGRTENAKVAIVPADPIK
jgi:hypothetical protein